MNAGKHIQTAVGCKGYECLAWKDSCDLGAWRGSSFSRGDREENWRRAQGGMFTLSRGMELWVRRQDGKEWRNRQS